MDKNLEAFGRQLRLLRKKAEFIQDGLAERLNLIHSQYHSNDELRVDGNLISKWERAFKNDRGRTWQPQRHHVLYLIEAFAKQLSAKTAHEWALQAGYAFDIDQIKQIFPPISSPNFSDTSLPPRTNFKQLSLLLAPHLFGVTTQQQQVYERIVEHDAQWLIALDGIGGIGKTALASALVHSIMATERFHDLVWVSAKQEELLVEIGLNSSDPPPALDPPTLTDALLEQVDHRISLARPADEKLTLLRDQLKQRPYLIVVDNLETIAEPSQIIRVSCHCFVVSATPAKSC